MAKLIALVLAAAALVANVQAACPPNANLCGSEIIDRYHCDDGTLVLITPAGNDPRDCHFFTNAEGIPQGGGVACCSVGRCRTDSNLNSFCD
ncbi:hypothetical protein MFIFM68171_09780 [Madurella fahalii]|uniref:Uncharacterized protein n=1 Tax=Madurella fahalii TaxID=1157608 RepID=A0ABQ0GPA7_9PEZI